MFGIIVSNAVAVREASRRDRRQTTHHHQFNFETSARKFGESSASNHCRCMPSGGIGRESCGEGVDATSTADCCRSQTHLRRFSQSKRSKSKIEDENRSKKTRFSYNFRFSSAKMLCKWYCIRWWPFLAPTSIYQHAFKRRPKRRAIARNEFAKRLWTC